MEISISTRHGHISEATQSKIRAKAEKLLRHFDRLTAMVVTIDLKDESEPRVDIKVSAEHAGDFVATNSSSSLLTAVENAVHKLDQQLKRNKEKVQERHRQPGARHVEVSEDLEEDDLEEVETDENADAL